MGQFVARYTQEGTNPPAHEVVRNSAGIAITYSRIAPGVYQGAITPALPAGSYLIRHNCIDEFGEKCVGATLVGTSTLNITTRENGVQMDEIFGEVDFLIEIVTP